MKNARIMIAILCLGLAPACDRSLSRWDKVSTTVPNEANGTKPEPKDPTPTTTPIPTLTPTPTSTPPPVALPTLAVGADAIVDTPLTRTATITGTRPDGSNLLWSKVSGPGIITFSAPDQLSTAIAASADGIYLIRLTLSLSDGRSTSADFQMTWDNTPPSAPSSLALLSQGVDTTDANTSNLTLTWTAASDALSGIASYRVDVYHAASCGGSPVSQTSVTNTSLPLSSLTDGTVVSFMVTAFDGLGHSTASICSHDTTIDLTPPPAIAPITATAIAKVGQSTVSVNFTGVTTDVDKVEIRRQVATTAPTDCSSGLAIQRYIAPSIPTTTQNFIDETYAAGSVVSYRACVFDKAGNVTTNGSTHIAENIVTRPHILFVTSTVHKGNFGGLSAADTICQNLANSSAITEIQDENHWKALLSDSSISAKARLNVTGQVVYPNPLLTLASTRAAFWSGTLTNTPNSDETGGLSFNTAWTGSSSTGAATANHCNNWSSANIGVSGEIGDPTSNTATWLSDNTGTCDTDQVLYCLSQYPPHPFTSFTATTAPVTGAIDLAVGLPTAAVPVYAELVITRLSGAVPPAADCSNGTEITRRTSLSPPSLGLRDSSATPAGGTFSYRVCALDPFGSLIDQQTVTATSGP